MDTVAAISHHPFFILLAAIVAAWFCIGGGKIVRGFKRHEFAVGQVVGTAVSVFLIGPVIVVPLRFLYLGEISQSELELIQSSPFLLAVGLFFAFLTLGDLHERRESY